MTADKTLHEKQQARNPMVNRDLIERIDALRFKIFKYETHEDFENLSEALSVIRACREALTASLAIAAIQKAEQPKE
jgi:hypothetical protein